MGRIAVTATFFTLFSACSTDLPGQSEFDVSSVDLALVDGSAEADAVLALVNHRLTTYEIMDDNVGLDRRAARNIVDYRNGHDGIAETADDNSFDTVGELDAVRYVGKSALARLLDFARENGWIQGSTPISPAARERTVLAVVNDLSVGFSTLDLDVGLDRRAANNIVSFRDGADQTPGTSDDALFRTIAELDAISYVGEKALRIIFEYGLSNGYHNQGPVRTANVIFSPNIYAQSHNVRVAQIIDAAQHSLDIAMYSYSDAGIATSLENAVRRGVQIRFIFETANKDRKLDPSERGNTKSGRLEAMGIDVRWVNKIMHHKFVIVDGPRDELSRAETATLVTGSGNWSNGAATRYDENTLFLTG